MNMPLDPITVRSVHKRWPPRSSLISAVTVAALAGCSVGPNFDPPSVTAPPAWHTTTGDGTTETTSADIDDTWWRSFKDPTLDRLVERAARQNLDLAAAAERVRQAMVARNVSASVGMPQLGAGVSQVHDRVSGTGTSTLVTHPSDAPLEYDDWQAGLDASWELDLFGRVRRAVEAANAGTEMAVEARRGIALDMLAELALAYMTLRGVQAREGIATHNLNLADHTLALVRNRYENGVGNELDVSRAGARRDAIAATLPPLRTAQIEAINAIGLLLAERPRALQAELAPVRDLPLVPPTVPAGLPSDLLRRRPDIRLAEAALHRATAATGVAVASFYPDISLTGSVGTEGLIAGNLFSLASRTFSIGPSVDIPIFQGGKLRGMLSLRKSQQREAAITYQKTVLQAWRDVDNAMTAVGETQHQRAALTGQVLHEQKALAAATQRYQQGSASFLDVDTAQASLLESQDALARSDIALRLDLVALYKALGGGWTVADGSQDSRRSRHTWQ